MRRRRGARVEVQEGETNSQEVDEHYWAQQAAQNADGSGEFGNDDDDAGPIPFDTQFLHEDEADFGGLYPEDDVEMDVGPSQTVPSAEEEDDLLAATQGQTAKRARPEYVAYAKRAKRVDVKRLKDSIWKELALPASPVEAS